MRRVASSMKLGFSLPVTGAWATPASQVRVAPRRDYPPMPGRPWPDCFESVADPVVSSEDVRRYAELGLTERFLEANVLLHDWPVERTLEIIGALSPARSLDAP